MNRRNFLQSALASIAAVSMRVACVPEGLPAIVEEAPIFISAFTIQDQYMAQIGKSLALDIDRKIVKMITHRRTQ